MRSATNVTMTTTNSASASVTAMWLVKVKLNGSRPSRLPNRMKKNSVKMNGKNFRPSWPIGSRHIDMMKS